MTGYLDGGETKKFHNISPSDIYVMGTIGDLIYWDGDGSKLKEFE